MGVWCSSKLCNEIVRKLEELDEGPGILLSAYNKQVPVFIPAFTDSEIGLDVSTWAMREQLKQQGIDPTTLNAEEVLSYVPPFNPFLDLQACARFASKAEQLGIMTIGGGVPRNWAQQIAPYVDITKDRVGVPLTPARFKYAIRICPDPVHLGGLSGCTYSEGVSGGKFVPASEGVRFAEVYADAMLAWPILMKAVFAELDL